MGIEKIVSSLGQMEVDPIYYKDLLLALSASTTPLLKQFNSRQLVTIICVFVELEAIDILPDGQFDDWIDALRVVHASTPMNKFNQKRITDLFKELNIDSSWIQQ